jgi:hypothetical protein
VKKVFVFTFEIVKCGGQTFPEISITSQSIQVNNKHLQKLWPRKRRESWFRRWCIITNFYRDTSLISFSRMSEWAV